ncbi:MAG TPA: dihydrodipicolinate synthase family protein [Casimicrobiaceae bacterium]|nr:dihydrodipicolinate synthase family protein [Casimicrobiaceae bacterium]
MPDATLAGVFPVLPTPFDDSSAVDEASLRKLIDYLLRCRVDGMTFPGVASEFSELSIGERKALTTVVLREVDGRVPVIAGVSSAQASTTIELAEHAMTERASALMIAVPPDRLTTRAQIEYFAEIAQAVQGAPIMLQNVPPPVGAGLAPAAVLDVLREVRAIRYVKEETLPSGQRLSELRAKGPANLAAVFGGAGGRYITDELRRGAAGTMPAVELAEVHVALLHAHRAGDAERVRELFTRMLPILNVQAVFRWSLTKYVLKRRNLIACDLQRAVGPRLDRLDQADVDAFLADIAGLLLPEFPLQ